MSYQRYDSPRFGRRRGSSRVLSVVLAGVLVVLVGGILAVSLHAIDWGAPSAPRSSGSPGTGIPTLSAALGLGSVAPQSGGPTSPPGSSESPGAQASGDPGAGPTTVPEPTATALPTPGPGPFEMDLYRDGVFVTEQKRIWCVPAAMQTSINIMSSGPSDVTRATQAQLYATARRLSPPTLSGPGAEPEGWARALNQLGYGRYAVAAEPSVRQAIQVAARDIRLTGRPAGLMVWRGAHSWVMSGFTATADPAFTKNYRVTAVYIEDVWYPLISKIHGASRPPDSLVPVSALPHDFLPWRRPVGGPYPDKNGKFVVVLPVGGSPATGN